MLRFFSRPIPLIILLVIATGIQVIMASFRVVEIPTGQLPQDSLRLAVAPVSMWLHALAGILFSLLGPLQFVRALRNRFGALHRFSGRVFVLSGAVLAISGLSLIWQLDSPTTQLVDVARAVFSAVLIVTLGLGIRAAIARNTAVHRAWMIRSYIVGVGGTSAAIVMFPLYLAGFPVVGIYADLVFVGWWLVTLAIGEWIIASIGSRQP